MMIALKNLSLKRIFKKLKKNLLLKNINFSHYFINIQLKVFLKIMSLKKFQEFEKIII